MTSKELVLAFASTFDVESVDWPRQMQMAKKLLTLHSEEQLRHALVYYKKKGSPCRSLGFFLTGSVMEDPNSILRAEKAMHQQGGTSSDRNQQRFRENREAHFGKESYFDLFEEPE
jgi:hypothetical protein